MTADRWVELRAPFPAAALRWRVQASGFSADGRPWIRIVPYLPAPAIRERLDQVLTPAGWQLELREVFPATHGTVEAGILARLSLWDGARWIVREDGAGQTAQSPLKGAITGAFRRAAAAWGIGVAGGERFAELSERRTETHSEGPVEIKAKDGARHGRYWWARPGVGGHRAEPHAPRSSQPELHPSANAPVAAPAGEPGPSTGDDAPDQPGPTAAQTGFFEKLLRTHVLSDTEREQLRASWRKADVARASEILERMKAKIGERKAAEKAAAEIAAGAWKE